MHTLLQPQDILCKHGKYFTNVEIFFPERGNFFPFWVCSINSYIIISHITAYLILIFFPPNTFYIQPSFVSIFGISSFLFLAPHHIDYVIPHHPGVHWRGRGNTPGIKSNTPGPAKVGQDFTLFKGLFFTKMHQNIVGIVLFL